MYVCINSMRHATRKISVPYIIRNNYEGSYNHGPNGAYQCTFNPSDEYRNEVQENKRLAEENKKLYESLLKAEREKTALLERLLNEKR